LGIGGAGFSFAGSYLPSSGCHFYRCSNCLYGGYAYWGNTLIQTDWNLIIPFTMNNDWIAKPHLTTVSRLKIRRYDVSSQTKRALFSQTMVASLVFDILNAITGQSHRRLWMVIKQPVHLMLAFYSSLFLKGGNLLYI
jgi:hypothetical protein